MSFHEEELNKIKRAATNPLTRFVVAQALRALRPHVEAANSLEPAKRAEALKILTGEAVAARHQALLAGASSYSHPGWAAAAACENWLDELLSGTPDSIARLNQLVAELSAESDCRWN